MPKKQSKDLNENEAISENPSKLSNKGPTGKDIGKSFSQLVLYIFSV